METDEQLRRWAQGIARQRAAKLAKIVPITIDGEGWAEAAFDGYQPYVEQRAGYDSLPQMIARMQRQ